MTLFAIYGTFSSGQAGHPNLEGAQLVERVRTAPAYRLYLVEGRWPALAPADDGVAIECELYDFSEDVLARLAELELPGWKRGPLQLADGREVEAFLGDRELVSRAVDLSHHGSWPAFVAGR